MVLHDSLTVIQYCTPTCVVNHGVVVRSTWIGMYNLCFGAAQYMRNKGARACMILHDTAHWSFSSKLWPLRHWGGGAGPNPY